MGARLVVESLISHTDAYPFSLGKVYKLDKLPAGYALYERPRRVEKAHVCVPKYLSQRRIQRESLI